MNGIDYIAFLCTDPAPVGEELAQIIQITAIALVLGIGLIALFFWIFKNHINNKVIRLAGYVVLALLVVGGLFAGWFFYAISTCGT